MTEEIRSVGFVCLANYCRSPVAKMILKNKFKNSLNVDSAGLSPMVSAGMDPRSVDYLKATNISYEIHTPKKIDKNFLKAPPRRIIMINTLLQNNSSNSKRSATNFILSMTFLYSSPESL